MAERTSVCVREKANQQDRYTESKGPTILSSVGSGWSILWQNLILLIYGPFMHCLYIRPSRYDRRIKWGPIELRVRKGAGVSEMSMSRNRRALGAKMKWQVEKRYTRNLVVV
jgi:hypothetical protein